LTTTQIRAQTVAMQLGGVIDNIAGYVRLSTAVLPFLFAFLMRTLLGENRLIGWMLTLTVAWFAVNVLLSPYSPGMRQDLYNLRNLLP
jgi:hypothetical protein